MCCDENNLLDDYDEDCYELDVIDEQIHDYHLDEPDIDDYWSKAWVINDEGFHRSDCDVYNDREYRVFPTRYRLKDFVFTKSLRRILKKNRDLKTVVRGFRPTEGKDDLLTVHRQERFKSERPRQSLKTSYEYLEDSEVAIMETCVFKGDKLVACSVFFVSPNSVTSSICFWDTNELPRSLGILTVLLEIKYAIENDKEYYYLGDLITQNPNYAYKSKLPALELWDWDHERWADYKTEQTRIQEMYKHKFRCRDDFDKDPKFTLSLLQNASFHHPHIIASALVGSRARGTEREDSDYDLIMLTDKFDEFFDNGNRWEAYFHRWRESKVEDRGAFKTLRAFYKNGDVFEFNFAPPSWAANSNDKATRRIVKDGMKILHDPQDILKNLQNAVLSKKA